MNRSMEAKHLKAKKEAMKAALENENARSASGKYFNNAMLWHMKHPVYGVYWPNTLFEK